MVYAVVNRSFRRVVLLVYRLVITSRHYLFLLAFSILSLFNSSLEIPFFMILPFLRALDPASAFRLRSLAVGCFLDIISSSSF